MSGVARIEFPAGQVMSPWDVVAEISSAVDSESWVLIGGLMVQAHALMSSYESRATVDVDMLIDVLADSTNITHVIEALESLDFEAQEPAFRKSPFHRLMRGEQIVDVLIADHLPSGRRAGAKMGALPLLETLGGAQAIDRKMKVEFKYADTVCTFYMPDVLGALVIKGAAYSSDNRDRDRHLEDAALLASLVGDVKHELDRLRGSDKKRLRSLQRELAEPNHLAWLNLPAENRQRGQDVLRILSS